MRIFISAMPGCGNYGDDLSSYLLIQSLMERYGSDVEIGLRCGVNINVNNYSKFNNLFFFPFFGYSAFRSRIISNNRARKYIKHCDQVIIGPGGLFQDSHYRFTIHKYLRYIRYFKKSINIVSVGVGPINSKINKFYLKYIYNNFNLSTQLRDLESSLLLSRITNFENFDVSCDIVEGTDLSSYFIDINKEVRKGVLGCSIRKWKDLTLDFISNYIYAIVKKYNFNEINLFVFEFSTDNTEEYDFAISIKQKIETMLLTNNLSNNIVVKTYTYTLDELFVEKFLSVEYGIASRYHANILWQKFNVPTIPLPYAPKVRSLYLKKGVDIKATEKLTINDKFISITMDDTYKLPDVSLSGNSLSLWNYLFFYFFDILEFSYAIYRFFYSKIKKYFNISN